MLRCEEFAQQNRLKTLRGLIALLNKDHSNHKPATKAVSSPYDNIGSPMFQLARAKLSLGTGQQAQNQGQGTDEDGGQQ
jgi:hypothetical protein